MLQLAPAGGPWVAAGMVPVIPVIAEDRSKTDPGPANPGADAPESRFHLARPRPIPSRSFEPSSTRSPWQNKRAYEGGWSREVTVRELPVSVSMAGVNMRLTAGGRFASLHWHTAGEWGDHALWLGADHRRGQPGPEFWSPTSSRNDLWYFPSGTPTFHPGPRARRGAEFIARVRRRRFSLKRTPCLLSDSMAHLPPEVLAKNFGVSATALKKSSQAGIVHIPGGGTPRSLEGRPDCGRGRPRQIAGAFSRSA